MASVFSAHVLSCSIPRSGPEYNSLISVEKLDSFKFKVVIPQAAGDLDFGVSIVAAYYPAGSGGLPVYYRNITEKESGSKYEATFSLAKIDGYTPYIRVFWYPEFPGLCGAYGISTDLVLG